MRTFYLIAVMHPASKPAYLMDNGTATYNTNYAEKFPTREAADARIAHYATALTLLPGERLNVITDAEEDDS